MEAVNGPKIQNVKLYITNDNRPNLMQKWLTYNNKCLRDCTQPQEKQREFTNLRFPQGN